MKLKKNSINTSCVHAGELKDETYGGATAPIYMSTAYDYRSEGTNLYPRYMNTPNQVALAKKMAALEYTESALITASGMAAISAVFTGILQQGDHIVLQESIYGGTSNFVTTEFEKTGIEFTFINEVTTSSLTSTVQKNTKMIYIETPSNPLLKIVDIEEVSAFAKARSITTVVDNTFASPVNQNPAVLGIDIVLHSATKYLGGHSDITAGVICSTSDMINKIWNTAKNYGGSISDQTAWLLERSIKTLGLRVQQQTHNAQKIAEFLDAHPAIEQVYYPGLQNHKDHAIASKQMKGYGGMLSFTLEDSIDHNVFLEKLQLIKVALSLAGVESTILSPALTSHSLLTDAQRDAQGISSRLLRFSTGIEDVSDLISDIEQAIKHSK